jgi:hypothetical protein
MLGTDMSDALDLVGGLQTIALYRRAPGHLTSANGQGPGGVWTERQPRLIQAQGVLQPAGRREMVLLEGNRAEDMRVFITTTKVQTVSDPAGAGADRIMVGGDWFQAQTVDDWTMGGVSNYYRVIFVRMRLQDPPSVSA